MPVDPGRATVYEHGWQSWSPSGLYPANGRSPRPPDAVRQTMGYRPGRLAPESGFQGEGLVALVPEEGQVCLWTCSDPTRDVPSIRVSALKDRLLVSADGPVCESAVDRLGSGLAEWAGRIGPPSLRTVPAGWCSWYCFFAEVTETLVLANLAAIDRLDLPIEIVQIDDGHQACVGDWLEVSPRFGNRRRVVEEIRASGRAAGVWTAPFLVTASSQLAGEHRDWLVGEASAGRNWGDELRILDVTHPEAAAHLEGVYRALSEEGFTYFKLDFLYAGAIEGRRWSDAAPLESYREGLRIVREGVGENAILLGCGAPVLPSIGLVDAMRIGPDVASEPQSADPSLPSLAGAFAASRARAWMHGRLWINDPDCLIVGPDVEEREVWAEQIATCQGLVFSSDDLMGLDERGLELARATLRPSIPEPVAWDPFDEAVAAS